MSDEMMYLVVWTSTMTFPQQSMPWRTEEYDTLEQARAALLGDAQEMIDIDAEQNAITIIEHPMVMDTRSKDVIELLIDGEVVERGMVQLPTDCDR